MLSALKQSPLSESITKLQDSVKYTLSQDLNNIDVVKVATNLEQWGNDRRIDPILLSLNTKEYSPIDTAREYASILEDLEPIALEWGYSIERDSRKYATRYVQSLIEKFGKGGFSIEGISPITGDPSGYPRFRPLEPVKYFEDGKVKNAKYLSRKGSAPNDFYARVPLHIAELIADRYDLTYDRPDGDYAGFWQWAKDHSLPILLVEGEGDALATLSRGYVAIGIPGHNMAFQKGTREFREEMTWILGNGSPVIIALDRDEKPKTIAAVDRSRQKIGNALERLGNEVRIAVWKPTDGKGSGDLPPEILDQAVLTASPLESMGERITRSLLQKPWEGKIDHTIMGSENLEAFLKTIAGDVCIIAPCGAGKTEALKCLAQDQDRSHIAVAPLRSLTYGLAGTLDLGFFNDGGMREIDDRIAVVVNSLHKVNPLRAYNLYLDEFEQSLDSLYRGRLNRENRSDKIENFGKKVKGADRLILSSATALPRDLEKIEAIRGKRITRIRFIPTHGHEKAPIVITQGDGSPGSQSTAKTLMINALEMDIRNGKSGIIACDTARQALELGILAQEWGLNEAEILVYSRDTLDDERINGFRQAHNKGAYLAKLGIRFFVYSPIMLSGDSLRDPKGVTLFDCRYGFIEGGTIAPANAVQFLNRYRSTTPITVALPIKGHFTPLIRGSRKLLEHNAQNLGLLLGRLGKTEVYALENDQIMALQFQNYGLAFRLWAEGDGHSVELDQVPSYDLKRINALKKVREYKALPILRAEPITEQRAKELQDKPEPTIAESYSLKAWKVRDFYGLDWDAPLSLEQVIGEGFGKGTRQFNRLLQVAVEGYAEQIDRAELEKLGSNPYVHDLPIAGFRLALWEKLGVLEIIGYCLCNEYHANDPTLRAWWDRIWSYQGDLQKYPKLLGFTLSTPRDGDGFYDPMVRAIGTLLNSLGFKTKSRRSRENDLLRIYRVTAESIAENGIRLSRYLNREGAKLRSTPLVSLLLAAMDHPKKLPHLEGDGGQNWERNPDPPPKIE